MKKDKHIDWPYFSGLILIPVVVVAFLFIISVVQGLFRYDPAYFTEEYRARYDTPGSVAVDLERALQDGDENLMEELLGTRHSPKTMPARPDLVLTVMVSSSDKYFHYLYFETRSYRRDMRYVKERDGRFIASETDLYFYMDSGQWRKLAGPLAAIWWILVIVFTTAVYVYRRMAAVRKSMFG